MNDIAIRCEGLGKLYRIGRRERYKTLRDTLADSFTAPLRWARNGRSGENGSAAETVWALKDVSFEVRHGEVVGVIGRNGAGKSTLLKILSRITEPTEGGAEIHGRVGSLLEVGTGFHPELTGRENIYLNGAILGMKRAEIDRKFDEIVAFAEVEKFIDTPVKHYSSGMYVRLAFAVAAHLDPEILVVDEVLAVGDLAFQKKCLGKLGDVAKGGRTVLFVSHQMNQLRRLCEHCIWLEEGKIRAIASAAQVISEYEAAQDSTPGGQPNTHERGSRGACFMQWEIVDPPSSRPNLLSELGPVTVAFSLKVNHRIRHGHYGIALFRADKQLMWANALNGVLLEPGSRQIKCLLPGLPLRPGTYLWQVSLYDERGLVDLWYGSPELIIGTPPLSHPNDQWQGILNINCAFQIC